MVHERIYDTFQQERLFGDTTETKTVQQTCSGQQTSGLSLLEVSSHEFSWPNV